MKMLLVEADEAMRGLMQAVLRARGHEVTTVVDGTSAIASFSMEHFPLVVLDAELPDLDGLEVCRRLRRSPHGAGAMIVVCTHQNQHDAVQRVLEAGADDYLTKPLDMGLLSVRLAVFERQAQRAVERQAEIEADLNSDDAPTEEIAQPSERQASPKREAVGRNSRYELIDRIGRGGTSDVFKAYDKELGEIVALKVLKFEWSDDESWTQRLRHEIRLSRQIKNQHVATIYEIGRMGERAFLAMEYVPGVPLAEIIQQRGSLTEEEALDIAEQAADGLAACHRTGIVHRDIKSSNLMVTPEGKAIVLDFGLARRPEDIRITHDGMLLGTPAYMAPEQFEEKPLVPATDVYSFGCVLYEMLTGTVPFEGKNLVATAQRHLMERPRPLRTLNAGVSAYFEGIVLKCLAKTPGERYRDAAALREDLQRARERHHHKEPTEVQRKRAILGEPDAEEARIVSEILDRFGLDVVRVTDGYGLVEAALGRGTDVIFVNVYMPKISGLEASQILRSFPRTAITPIVLLSDRSADRDLAKLIPRGGEFLKKPIEDDDFTSLFKRLGLPTSPG